MSNRWPGGVITKTPVTPTGPLQNGTAPGMWSMADAAYWIKQGLWPTAGNFLAVEDVFSTYLYTGNGATGQTISNGINLSGQGGMVWIKDRTTALNNILYDTQRTLSGSPALLNSNTTVANTYSTFLTGFTTSGFSVSGDGSANSPNKSGDSLASWTFRKAQKFFDVVTYTGTGSATTIAHNLGITPGCIIVKRTDTTANWAVYHRGNTSAAYYEKLNLTDAQASDSTVWNSTDPTSSVFSVGTSALTNASGGTYVAYLFAHDTSSTGIIQCGSYTGNGYAGAVPNTVTLGWEPQWVMVKKASSGVAPSDWFMFDNMRGMPVASAQTQFLSANTSGSEIADVTTIEPTSTGFQLVRNYSGTNANGETYIYIAIRRGPMRTPTLGTTVFTPITGTLSAGSTQAVGFPADATITKLRTGAISWWWTDKLRGYRNDDTVAKNYQLSSDNTDAESTLNNSAAVYNMWNTTALTGSYFAGASTVFYHFRRAPSFFDEVCYTGTGGTSNTFSHNLGVAPELVIIKSRSVGGTGYNWPAITNTTVSSNATLFLNSATSNSGGNSSGMFTATTVNIGSSSGLGSLYGNTQVNASGTTYVAYLFASCPGVSKVGSYTGTGALQTVNCGFTTGARFVLIKRTDSTGDWYVWDSARGITSGNDPYLLMNSTAAEVTSTNYVDTDTTGFKVTAAAPAALNASGGTYIFLAVA